MEKNEILSAVLEYSKSHIKPKSVTPIQASGVEITPEDVQSIVETALSFWYTDGKACAKFRRELKNYVGKAYISLVNSGSSATLIALRGCIDYFEAVGSYVVTTALNFPTTVASIIHNNKIPIYIDTDPYTLAPDYDQLEYVMSKYDDKICGAMLTHTLGFPFDEYKVFDIVSSFAKFLITDNCDALGAMLDIGSKVGRYADASTYSFFPAHHISTGEGGAIATNNVKLNSIMESYINWGRDCYCSPGQSNTCGKRFEYKWDKLPDGWDHKYTFTRVGYNLKMTELQAALGYSQMKRIDDIVHKRRKNFLFLSSIISDYDTYGFFKFPEYNFMNISPFGCPILVTENAPFTTDQFIFFLEKNEIRTRRMFAGNITRQPAFQGFPYISVDLSGTDKVMENMIWVGCQDALTGEQMKYTKDKIKDFMERYE